MAITVIKSSGTTPIADGTTYDPAPTGSEQAVDSLQLYRDAASGGVSSDYQLNSVNFQQDISIVSQGLQSFTMYATAGRIVQASIPASGTYDAKIDLVANGNGGNVSTVSGAAQTGTLIKDLQLQTFANNDMPSLTYSISAGDRIVVAYESNGGTFTPPTTASNGDSYGEIGTGTQTGSPLTEGKQYELIATSDMTAESVGGWSTGNISGTIYLAVFAGSVATGNDISATTDTLTFTENAATVEALVNSNISATLDALNITAINPTVSTLVNNDISATIDSLALTTNNPTVSAQTNTSITATIDAITLSALNASVSALVNSSIAATLDPLTLSALNPSVSIQSGVSALPATVSLSFTPINPVVEVLVNNTISATLGQLTISSLNASISSGQEVPSQTFGVSATMSSTAGVSVNITDSQGISSTINDTYGV